MRIFLFLLVILALGACGIGGGGDEGGGSDPGKPAVPALTPVTTLHPSGRIHEQGLVVTATGERTGVWSRHFDAEESPKEWQGTYTGGTVDQAAPWTEWNLDGSVRIDSTDR